MTTEGYRNKPQFNFNPALNEDISPNVPDFNSNAMDNDGFIQLNNCSNCGHHDHDKDDKEHKNHQCCHGNHSACHTHDHHCHRDHK
ncbi:hypothetical protein H9L25_02410 [Terrisporobacter mayombei]|nr:hypothetical protein [Terrisporobacter mayombei]